MCVEKEDGKRFVEGSGGLGYGYEGGKSGEEQEMLVVFDGEGRKLKVVLAGLEDRKRREREERMRMQKEFESPPTMIGPLT